MDTTADMNRPRTSFTLPSRRAAKRGFTLLELSIVLAIIALIVGGVMVGQDMIHAAEIRAQISQIEEMNVAVNAFRNKYNCLPGDCAHAVEFGLGEVDGVGNDGDGDGLIVYLFNGTVDSNYGINSPEAANFWYHLSQTQLIAGNYQGYPGPYSPPDVGVLEETIPGINTPPLKLKGKGIPEYTLNSLGGFWILPMNYNIIGTSNIFPNARHAWWLTSNNDYHAGTTTGIYLAPELYAMDVKIDDGLPRSGIFFTVTLDLDIDQDWRNGDPPPFPIATYPNACINNSAPTMQYNLISSAPSCKDGTEWCESLCSPLIATPF